MPDPPAGTCCATGLGGALAESAASEECTVGGFTVACPLARGYVRVVEIVEVVTHGGETTTQPVASRDQYVNLDDQVERANAHPEYGRTIKLKARLEWQGIEESRLCDGQTVYWYFTPNSGNKSGLTGEETAGFGSATVTERTSSPTNSAGWSGVVEFRLSRFGGDRFTVYATEDPAYTGGLSAGPYTVWKKFWFQVTEMLDQGGSRMLLPTAVKRALETGYESVKTRFVEEGVRLQTAHQANLPDHTARVNLANGILRRDDRIPFKLHVVTIDFASNPADHRIAGTATSASFSSGTDCLFLWNRGTATHPWKVTAKYRPSGTIEWSCHRVSPACGRHTAPDHLCDSPSGSTWTCGAQGCPAHTSSTDVCPRGPWHCTRVDPPCPGHSARSHQCGSGTRWTCRAVRCAGHQRRSEQCGPYWADIPDAWLSLWSHGTRRGFKVINVDFPASIVPSATAPVEVELVVKKFDAPALGWGGGAPAIFLCTGALRDWFASSEWDLVQKSDLVHEVGHALGLINMTPSPANAHDAWREPTNVHHCSQPSASCAMYYASSTTRATIFHPNAATGPGCHDALRRQDYARARMTHWNP